MLRLHTLRRPLLLLLACIALAPFATGPQAQKLEPLLYTISFPQPASRTFNVHVTVPTAKRRSIDLMMPVWSPGVYGLQNYSRNVSAFKASASDGTTLDVTQPNPSRWTIKTGGRQEISVTYTLAAPRGSNLSSGVTETSAVIIGPS